MTISASELVDIQSAVLGAGLNGLELNGLALTRNAVLPTDTIYKCYSAEQAKEYFGSNSEEAKLASVYFLSEDNKQKVPTALMFYRHDNVRSSAFVRGGAVTDLETLKADKAFLKIKVDGQEKVIADLDTSAITSFSELAEMLEVEGATVAYNSNFNGFTVTSNGIGTTSDVDYATETSVEDVESKPATYISGEDIDIEALKEIDSGEMTFTVNGTEYALANLDFSTIESLSGAITILNSALVAQDCPAEFMLNGTGLKAETFDKDDEQSFDFASSTTSGLAGALKLLEADGATIEAGLTGHTEVDLAVAMKLMEVDGAIKSVGKDAETLTQTLDEVFAGFKNFFGIATIFQETQEEALEIAQWVNAKGTNFCYFMTETDEGALVSDNKECFGYLTKDYIGICPTYNTKENTFFVMSVPASTDYQRANGRKVLAFRSQGGLEPTCEKDADARNLIANGYNFYGAYATKSDEFKMEYNGQVSGKAKFLDTYAGQVWLASSLQATWLTLMKASARLPYAEEGYGAIRASSMDTINQALNAGIIVKGVKLSETQKTVLMQQTGGEDISEALNIQGWYLQVADVDIATRTNRGAVKPNFWYCDGGSIQKIEGLSTTIL